MSTKKRGLGKGLNELLSATLGSAVKFPIKEVSDDPVELLVKDQALLFLSIEKMMGGVYQPRQQIKQEDLEELAESIRAQGILQPIIVRPKGERFEIIAGERRWRAAKLAGLAEVPVIVRTVPDNVAMAIALVENIQRKDLNPVEEALAIQRLAEELQLTHLQVAEAVGKSRVSVTNLLRLLSLNPDVLNMLEQAQLEMGHARALLGLSGDLQSQVAQTVYKNGLSVRQTEQLVSKFQTKSEMALEEKSIKVDPNIQRLEQDLADKLGTPIAIRHGRRGGTIVIKYHNLDELEGILAHIN